MQNVAAVYIKQHSCDLAFFASCSYIAHSHQVFDSASVGTLSWYIVPRNHSHTNFDSGWTDFASEFAFTREVCILKG